MFFVMVMSPLMRSLSPATRGELISRLFPRLTRYVSLFSILTVVMGVLLALGMARGRLDLFSPGNPWGFNISVGGALALLTAILALGVVLPTARRIVKLLDEMQRNPQGAPQADMVRLQKRMRVGATTVLALLILVLVFMVAAARLV